MNCLKRNHRSKKKYNKFRKKCRDYLDDRPIPKLDRCIRYSQTSFKLINQYLNIWPVAYFDEFVYQGAKQDFRLNCNTKYMEELSSKEIDKMHLDILSLINTPSDYTSRIALLYNYSIGKYTDKEIKEKAVNIIIDSKSRFSMMYLLKNNDIDYQLIKGMMSSVLSNISESEKQYLWIFIHKVLEINGNYLDTPSISNVCNLIKDFYEL